MVDHRDSNQHCTHQKEKSKIGFASFYEYKIVSDRSFKMTSFAKPSFARLVLKTLIKFTRKLLNASYYYLLYTVDPRDISAHSRHESLALLSGRDPNGVHLPLYFHGVRSNRVDLDASGDLSRAPRTRRVLDAHLQPHVSDAYRAIRGLACHRRCSLLCDALRFGAGDRPPRECCFVSLFCESRLVVLNPDLNLENFDSRFVKILSTVYCTAV